MTELDLHELDLGVIAGRWLKDLADSEEILGYLHDRWPDLTPDDFDAAVEKMREYADAYAPDPDVGAAAVGRLHRRWEDARQHAPYNEADVVGTL